MLNWNTNETQKILNEAFKWWTKISDAGNGTLIIATKLWCQIILWKNPLCHRNKMQYTVWLLKHLKGEPEEMIIASPL